jgi:hypothetical protein
MNLTMTIVVLFSALLLGAADVHAMAWGGGHARGRESHSDGSAGGRVPQGNGQGSRGARTPLPEPSTLYAVGSSLALLAGAGWYVRRRD